jgi:hypothetical protein
MDLVPCKVKFSLLQSNFFPPNFSFVFWKFWREKIYFAKEAFPWEITV